MRFLLVQSSYWGVKHTMSKPYRLVVFDWEGTLGEDGFSILLSIMSQVSQRMLLGSLDLSAARRYINAGLVTTIKQVFPEATLYQQEELLYAIQKEVTESSTTVRLMAGAWEVLQWLNTQNVHLAIATNKSHQGLMHALAQTGLDVIFKVTRTASQAPPKPCPQMLEEIIDVFGVDASQTLMIGDSTNDMLMAAAIGVDALGVDFFHQEAADLREAGALHVVDDYQQLLQYLKE